jgi:hypothetical protein
MNEDGNSNNISENNKLINNEIKDSEPTENLIQKEQNTAMIYTDKLNDKSSLSYLYLTSVYHENVDELKNILQNQFEKITENKINFNSYLNVCENSFAKELIKNEEEQEIEKNFSQKEFYTYTFFVTLLSIIIQFSFVSVILKEYFYYPIFNTNKPELITLRLIILITIILKIYIIFLNNKKIITHSIQQQFLYKSKSKKNLTLFLGILNFILNLMYYYVSAILISLTQQCFDCVKIFAVIIILTEIDGWICDYFIGNSKQLKIYSRGFIEQVCLGKTDEFFKCGICDLIINVIIIFVFVMGIIPIYNSLSFTE